MVEPTVKNQLNKNKGNSNNNSPQMKEFREATSALPSSNELPKFPKDDFMGSKLHGDELLENSPSMLQPESKSMHAREQVSSGSKVHGDDLFESQNE